jgi:predicted metal-binding membrane protein
MTGMTMSQGTWYGAAAGYLGMWMAMMVPMMLPSLVPMLSRYRRSVCGADGVQLHGLTALVAAGYFVIWAIIGAVADAASGGVMAIQMRSPAVADWLPAAAGTILLLAGGVQLSAWKARQLALCREEAACGCSPAATALSAWRHGLRLGVRCSLCCGNLMLALLVVGVMDPVAMGAVTLAITAERLVPAPLQVARLAGAAMLVVGALTIAGA